MKQTYLFFGSEQSESKNLPRFGIVSQPSPSFRTSGDPSTRSAALPRSGWQGRVGAMTAQRQIGVFWCDVVVRASRAQADFEGRWAILRTRRPHHNGGRIRSRGPQPKPQRRPTSRTLRPCGVPGPALCRHS